MSWNMTVPANPNVCYQATFYCGIGCRVERGHSDRRPKRSCP